MAVGAVYFYRGRTADFTPRERPEEKTLQGRRHGTGNMNPI